MAKRVPSALLRGLLVSPFVLLLTPTLLAPHLHLGLVAVGHLAAAIHVGLVA